MANSTCWDSCVTHVKKIAVSLNGFGIRIQNDVKEKLTSFGPIREILYHQAVTLASTVGTV